MNYSKRYLNFINGRYVNEGLRITAGVLLPSFLMNYFDMLGTGLVISLGALCVSVADTPGAVKHRVNGMLACCIIVAAISVLVNYATASVVLLGAVITLAGFFLSMFTVYGNRASAVGIAAMLVMVLSLQTRQTGLQIWINAGYILAGGIWYMLYSLLLYRLRPYKFIQQVLADYIFEVAAYLKLRGDLYAINPAYEKINEELLKQQVSIEAQQNMVGELLFNTRTVLKESTPVARTLVKTYLEIADLYESVMTTYQQYNLLHQDFDNTGILQLYRSIIYSLSAELEEVSLALRSGVSSTPLSDTARQVGRARELFELLRQDYMSNENLANFVSLGRIQVNLEDLSEKINQLHLFTKYQVSFERGEGNSKNLKDMVPVQDIRPSLFLDNLNFQSNIFRHSIRVCLALMVGYIVSFVFKTDFGYWILLTIVVILKPAYSLTKKRNIDRLIGTAVGIVIGLVILLSIKNGTALLVIMILFMASSFMFMRTNYFWNVLLMTTYLIIFFHYLYPGDINGIMLERIIDTAVGSGISFFASLFFIPAWERDSIKSYMLKILEANDRYYSSIAIHFCNDAPLKADYIRTTRREALIALANLSDAFARMLSEPRRQRQGIKNVHQFVASNHNLISYIASLSYLLQTEKNKFYSPAIVPVMENTQLYFKNAGLALSSNNAAVQEPDSSGLKLINEEVQALLDKRKIEIAEDHLETNTKSDLVKTKSVTDQFNFIYNTAAVIYKISSQHNAEMVSDKS